MQQANSAAVGRARKKQIISRAPQLLVTLEPWWPSFLHNLRDVFNGILRAEPPPLASSSPAEFWPDVFVHRPLPWKNFGQSAVIHMLALFCVFGGTKLWLSRQHVSVSAALNQTKLVYYNVSEYLPSIPPSPLPKAARAQKGAPAYAKQEIISVPKSPDNSTQTILNPPHPNVLPRSMNVDLPNLIAWSVAPQPPIAALSNPKLTMPAIEFTPVQPPPETRRSSQAKMTLPEIAAVQPAPETLRDSQPKMLKMPEAQVIEPPPSAEALNKRVDQMEIARLPLQPSVEAPKLPVPELQPIAKAEQPVDKAASPQSAFPPPAPSTQRSNAMAAMGQLIALSLQPKGPEKEIKIPDASRSGIFAASPTGKVGAPGLPEIVADNAKDSDGTPGSSRTNMPGMVGISVGGAAKSGHEAGSVVVAAAPRELPRLPERPRMMALASPPDIARRPSPSYSTPPDVKVEDRVFSGRKIYSMQLNMPNLTSAGGSWIIRFAELNEHPQPGDLSGPVATNKVDPAYPPQLIREQVEGTVVLYAVIRSDGTVGDVRVLEGFHQQLDENARLALLRWHFRPAMKNGSPVDLEAVVQIPFRTRKIGFKY